MSTASMYAAAKADAMGAAPGEVWSYSDVGYFLLGMVIEKVTGQRYKDALSQRILQPLGMTSSRMLDQLRPLKHLAKGYTLYKNPAANGAEELVNIRRVVDVELTSHYGLFSTVKDLAKWDAALYTEKPLKQSSLKQMWTPARLKNGSRYDYGFGWDLSQRRGHSIVAHSGLTGTYILRVPDIGLTVVVLTNLGRWASGGSRSANPQAIAYGIATLSEPALRLTPIEDRDPDVTRKARSVVTDLAQGKVDTSLVSAELAKNLAAAMDEIRPSFARDGKLQSMVLVDRFEEDGNHAFRYRLSLENASRILLFRFNPRGTIIDIVPEE